MGVYCTYPFYCTLELDPPGALAERIDERSAVVAPELLSRLGLALGDTLRIGDAEFELRGTVASEPDRQSFSLALGPRVFVTMAGFERANLEQLGSRIVYRSLVRMPDGTTIEGVRELASWLRSRMPDEARVRVETWDDAQPGLRRGIRRVDSYLGLVALLSLFVGGIGVAQTVRAWIAGKTDAIAVLECLGLRPRQVLGLFVAQTVVLALAGSAAGALIGALVQLAAPALAGDLLPAELIRPWQPFAMLRGLALGLGLALAFSLVPLLATLRVPPARVLRHDAAALTAGRPTRIAAIGVLLATVLVTATVQSRSLERGAVFTAGVLVAAGLLALAGRAVAALARRAPRERLPLALRHGIAALGRPQAGTQGGILALGLGALVVLALFLVQDGLARELSTGMPEDAPTVFTIDVQPDQWPGVQEVFRAHDATHVDSTPVVVARLAAIDGRPVDEILRERSEGDGRGSRWVLTREQRLTSR
jgi:putative ABC transport system permease protein